MKPSQRSIRNSDYLHTLILDSVFIPEFLGHNLKLTLIFFFKMQIFHRPVFRALHFCVDGRWTPRLPSTLSPSHLLPSHHYVGRSYVFAKWQNSLYLTACVSLLCSVFIVGTFSFMENDHFFQEYIIFSGTWSFKNETTYHTKWSLVFVKVGFFF